MPPPDDAGGGVVLVLGDGGSDASKAAHDGGGTDAMASKDAGPADSGPTALDPSLPTPSHDCRTDTSTNCISVAGTYNGASVDTFCNMADGTSVVVHAGEWVIGCDETNPGFARIYIPIQKPGSFAATGTPDASAPMDFELSADTTTSVALFTDNLVRASVAGTISTPSSSSRVVTGTFHGDWSTPDSSCLGLYSSPCAAANVNVTFRTASRYGSCLSDADCTAPQTCDGVGYFCE
jgi:hypothetical protein